jgi:hypothetical protein
VTTALSLAVALVTVALVKRLWNVLPPARTCLRSALVAALAYACAALVAAPGVIVVVKLAVVCVLALLALLALGEFSRDEIAWARSLLRRREPAPMRPPAGAAAGQNRLLQAGGYCYRYRDPLTTAGGSDKDSDEDAY